MLADLEGGGDGLLEIPDIVHCIEDAEDIHSVLGSRFYESVHNIIGVVSVTQNVLTAQQHLHARVGHGLSETAQPLPGILSQKTDTGIERRTAPYFRRP